MKTIKDSYYVRCWRESAPGFLIVFQKTSSDKWIPYSSLADVEWPPPRGVNPIGYRVALPVPLDMTAPKRFDPSIAPKMNACLYEFTGKVFRLVSAPDHVFIE